MTKTTTTTQRVMRRAMGTVAVVALLAGTTMIAPQGGGSIGFEGHPVFAAPGGNGNGNGNGGDNGNGGNSGNAGNAGSGSSDGDSADGETAHASELGRLNAAHASVTARANAAPDSAVGETAAHERDVLDGDLERAASELAEAANKDIVEPVVHAVNELLGIDDADSENEDGDRLTVHDTESEVAARADPTFDPSADGDTQAPEEGRDS
jgi:hypothetical protein